MIKLSVSTQIRTDSELKSLNELKKVKRVYQRRSNRRPCDFVHDIMTTGYSKKNFNHHSDFIFIVGLQVDEL